MSDQKVPEAPDYSPIINAYNAIAQHSSDQGKAAYDWAKGQVASNKNLIDQVNQGNLDTSQTFGGAAKNELAAGMDTQREATNYLRGQRDRYSNPTYVANDMGASEAQTGQAFDAARNSSIQELESFGVNPGATRFAGLDAGIRAQKAAAQAAAGTGAARQDQALSDQANAGLLQQGNTQTTQAAGLSGVGTAAGQGSVQNNLAGTASGANVLGTDLAWTGAQGNALNGVTNAKNTSFNNQAEADKISNSSSSGLGSLLGMGLSQFGSGGAFSGVGSAIGSALLAFEDGGAIPDANEGGQIPPGASPSGGAIPDDIPATAPGHPNIRLNGGEIIIPRDVAGFMGEKFFLDTINKARKSMPQGMAQQGQPKMGPAAVGGNPGGNPPGGQGPMSRNTPTHYMSGGTIADFRRADDQIEDRRGWNGNENMHGHPDPRRTGRTPTPIPRPDFEDRTYNIPAARSAISDDAGAATLDLQSYGRRRLKEGAVGR